MKGGPSVHKRMRLVSGVYRRREERRVTRILCERDGIDPFVFEADCRAWEARLRKEGITTLEERMERMAADLEIPIEQFRAEVDAIAAEVLAIREGRR